MTNKFLHKNFNNDNVINCDNVQICVGNKKNKLTLIENFSYTFKKGKIYALIGKSGVGKTTLISHLAGFYIPCSGKIFINDEVIIGGKKKIKNLKKIRKIVGLVFQFPEYQLFKNTVEKDVAFAPINYNVNKQEAIKLAAKYLYLVGLDKKLLKVNPFDLSNGQKRLVAIAGILALEPEVIILDEPTAGLDPYYQKKIINIIDFLSKQGKTIIIVTHNMNNVLDIADEVIALDGKKIIKSGTPYELFLDNKTVKALGIDVPYVIQEAKKHKNVLLNQPRNINELFSCLKKGDK